jgi:hypothetical protein
VEDIVSSVPGAGLPAPTISPVALGDQKMCSVARSLLFGIWEKVYGLEVHGQLFRVTVEYNHEPSKEAEFRRLVMAIVSSLTIHG